MDLAIQRELNAKLASREVKEKTNLTAKSEVIWYLWDWKPGLGLGGEQRLQCGGGIEGCWKAARSLPSALLHAAARLFTSSLV